MILFWNFVVLLRFRCANHQILFWVLDLIYISFSHTEQSRIMLERRAHRLPQTPVEASSAIHDPFFLSERLVPVVVG